LIKGLLAHRALGPAYFVVARRGRAPLLAEEERLCSLLHITAGARYRR
jgi:hypothetical protein